MSNHSYNTENEWSPLVRCIFEDDASSVPALVAGGEDPNGTYADMSLVALATYNGSPDVLEALISGGARVPPDALSTLGDMDITDYKIDPIELEKHYARVAQILLDHGATPDVPAYDGRPLIETFPAQYYPHIHRVLSQGARNKVTD